MYTLAPHSILPAGLTARFVLDQVGETLITLDCQGQVQPSLAASWTTEDGGLTWTFRLRRGARFGDGSSVTAGDVARGLAAGAAANARFDSDDALVAWAGIRSALVKGDSAIELRFDRAHQAVPRALAHPALAVVKQTPSGAVGSGPFRIAGTSDRGVELASGSMTLLAAWIQGDPRDAIDQDVDLLLTDDAMALAYASQLEAYRAIPLAWRHIYVLAMPRSNPLLVDVVDDPYLPGLIGRAARRASGVAWWRTVNCALPTAAAASPSATSNQRLVYRSGDAIAQRIAERLIVLAGSGTGERLTAVPLDPPDFGRAVRSGRDVGYVLALPLDPLAPCLPLGALVHRAPWLEVSSDAALRPVVETRGFAVVRPDRVAGRLEYGWDGSVRVLAGEDRQ